MAPGPPQTPNPDFFRDFPDFHNVQRSSCFPRSYYFQQVSLTLQSTDAKWLDLKFLSLGLNRTEGHYAKPGFQTPACQAANSHKVCQVSWGEPLQGLQAYLALRRGSLSCIVNGQCGLASDILIVVGPKPFPILAQSSRNFEEHVRAGQ